MTLSIWKLVHRVAPFIAVAALALAMGGTWTVAPAIASPGGATADSPGGAGSASATGTSSTVGSSSKTRSASASPKLPQIPRRGPKKQDVVGKLNLNTATPQQLMMLPSIGPSKAERIVTWRKRNGGFKRPADLRRVKGFGYKTFKRLAPFLEIRGDTTLTAKP